MSKALTLLLVGAIAVSGGGLLTACGSSGGSADSLMNASFATQEVTVDGVKQPLAQGSTLTITFTPDGMSAKAGCNTLFAAVSLDDEVITLSNPLGMTMMACEPALMDQDQWISDFLSSRPQWSLDGSILTLTSGGDVIVLRNAGTA